MRTAKTPTPLWFFPVVVTGSTAVVGVATSDVFTAGDGSLRILAPTPNPVDSGPLAVRATRTFTANDIAISDRART